MDFDFSDAGTGPALLFLPGSYSTLSAWKGVQKSLGGSYRVVSTSLPGYGGTPERRSQSATDMSQMSGFVAEVIGHVGQPVHLIGHSYGGLVAFAATLSGRAAPLSLITFEANPVFSRLRGPRPDWLDDVRRANQRFAAAVAAGDPDAPAIIIDFWSSPGVFRAMPSAVQDYCRQTAKTNLLDWQTANGFTPAITDYSAIKVPCTIVRGQYASAAIADISDQIAQQIGQSDLHVVGGAGHFLTATHPAECAAIIDLHMAAAAQG